MAGKRTPMSKIVEIKRSLSLGLSDRKIARALGVSRNTVAEVKTGSHDGEILCSPESQGNSQESTRVRRTPLAPVR